MQRESTQSSYRHTDSDKNDVLRQMLYFCILFSLFVQLLLSSLTFLLGALYWWHVLSHSWAWIGLVRSKLGVGGGVVLDGLDRELLLTLELHVSDSICHRDANDENTTYLLLLLVVAGIHVDILGDECSFGVWLYDIACRITQTCNDSCVTKNNHANFIELEGKRSQGFGQQTRKLYIHLSALVEAYRLRFVR